MITWLILVLLVAIIDWVAVARGWRYLEFAAKPGTMLILLIEMVFLGGCSSVLLVCFETGVFLSLLGDVFLLLSYVRLSNKWFLAGLAAFLLAHLAYITGLNVPLPDVSPIISVGVSIVLAISAGRTLGKIIEGVRRKGLRRLEMPVIIYGMVITIMLLSALLVLLGGKWSVPASLLVVCGAFLFYLSDILLAWNRFVNPVRSGRLINIILYHVGQIGLAAGVLMASGIA
jgi:uncharacterized membrane protein YhhN